MSMNQQGRPPEIAVSAQVRIVPPLAGREPEAAMAAEEIRIELEDERQIRLDPDDERSPGFVRVIQSLEDGGRPAAFELDTEERIRRVFIPHVSPVVRVLRLAAGVLSVELAASHARHTLRDTHPDFETFAQLLEEAAGSGAIVIVTEDDSHDILDVRIHDVPHGRPEVTRPQVRKSFLARIYDWFVRWIRCSCSFPWGWCRAISRSRAQQIFTDLAARTCNPVTPSAPCITFNYPDDGCWGRAHEIGRLMVEEGLKPCKVWIEGNLNVKTANHPSCEVFWIWHVAPTHCVRGSGIFGWLKIRTMVFDPALFSGPVTKSEWKSVQSDSNATLTTSSWTIFYLWGSGSGTSWFSLTDPSFTQTNSVLAHYRTVLLNRTINFGPPPYACT